MSVNGGGHRGRRAAWTRARRTLPFLVGLLAAFLRPAPCVEAAPPSRDLVVVLDVSRSMDDAFSRVIASLEAYLADAGPDDTLTFSTFGDGVKFVVRQRAMRPNPEVIAQQVLRTLAPTDRFTNITYAVDRALSELIRMGPAAGRLREFILITDGKHNPPPGSRFPVPAFEDLYSKASRLEPGQWSIRYLVLGSESDPDMTTFVRRFQGEATMLQHTLDARFQNDLTETLRGPWLPASVTVEAFQGEVWLERVGAEATTAAAGAHLVEGDRVRLGPDGYAMLRTAGGAHFGLNPDTQWVLEQARRDPRSGQVRVRGAVQRGAALATGADIPIVQIALVGPQGAIQTAEGTVGLRVLEEDTAVAATEAGAQMVTYAARGTALGAEDLLRPVVRRPGAGPRAAPRDPYPMPTPPEPIPGGAFSVAQFLGDWSAANLYDVEWKALFEGWRPTLETGTPLSAVPGAILVARQPPRLTDLVITADGEFEGDVLSDDENLIILQTEAGLRYFTRSSVVGVSFAAFPLSSGKVEDIVGTAEFQRQGRSGAWRELIVGTKLRPGDMVRTGDASRVVLTVAGQAVVSVKANSLFTLKDARRDNSTGDVRVRVALDAGQLWNDVGTLVSPRSRYIVETPQATSGVRGTVFTVVYDEEAEETKVATVEGAVQVIEKRQTLREIQVTQEQQTTLEEAEDQELVTETIQAETVSEWQEQEEEFDDRRDIMEVEYPPIHREPIRARLRSSLPEPQRAGRLVTWTATYLPDDVVDYEFEFALRGAGTDYVWAVVREFAPEAAWQWDTGRQDGPNLVRVRVRRADGEPMEDATTVVSYTIAPSRLGAVLLGLGVVWMMALVGGLALQLVIGPRAGGEQRLRVMEAPQGLPCTVLPLAPMSGLRWIDEVRVGRATDRDLTLGDEMLASTQCRVRRLRFGPWMRTTLIIEPGAPVFVDGVQTAPGPHRLRANTRLRMGEYDVRYEVAQVPLECEVICRDGRIPRGAAPKADLLTTRVLILQTPEPGIPPYTLPFSEIEHIRCYRTQGEDDRMRGKPGSATVGGPLVRVWFADSGEMITGRLETAAHAEEGRFRVYTDETHRLGYVLIVSAATKKIKVFPDTERPPTFTPKDQVAAGRGRLGLSGAGPTAVGQADIERSIERLHEARADTADATAAAGEDTPSPPPSPASPDEPKPDKPRPAPDRYVRRRGKPRI